MNSSENTPRNPRGAGRKAAVKGEARNSKVTVQLSESQIAFCESEASDLGLMGRRKGSEVAKPSPNAYIAHLVADAMAQKAKRNDTPKEKATT